jgi:hypothetical protein
VWFRCWSAGHELGARFGARAAIPADHRAVAVAPRVARPLKIVLRRTEDARRGVQTGDSDFDDAVRIDTRTPEPAVRFVLALPQARDAIRSLLFDEGFSEVVLDDAHGDVTARRMASDAPGPWRRDRAERVLESFRTLVDNLPAIDDRPSGR